MFAVASRFFATVVVCSLCTIASLFSQSVEFKCSTVLDSANTSDFCQSHKIYFQEDVQRSGYEVDGIRCHFKNHLSLYAYGINDSIQIELRGFSGGHIQGHEAEVDRTELLEDCDQLENKIVALEALNEHPFSKIERRDFSNRESVLIVASQRLCSVLGKDLGNLLSIYQDEGRNASRLYCVSDALVRQRNPARIQQSLRPWLRNVSGLLIVGSDIAPFEYFRNSGLSTGWTSYEYGMTDLPYGSLDNDFWTKPIKKSATGIAEVVYRSLDYVYTMQSPSLYTYDFDAWVRQEMQTSRPYRQEKWVSRWLADDVQIQAALHRFVERRRYYRPSRNQEMAYVRGGDGFMMTPGDSGSYKTFQDILQPRLASLDGDDHLRLYVDSDIAGFVKNVSDLSFLVLDEHGQPEGIGNLHAGDLVSKIEKAPEFLHIHSCSVGAWGYASSSSSSFIAQLFSVTLPPIATTASQGVLGIPTITKGVFDLRSPYLTDWKKGQSLGQRQLESLNQNLSYWRTYSSIFANYDRALTSFDIFHSTSIFGDGTIEF